jgi:hypothetical protein
MKASTSTNPFVSTFAISAWLLRPQQTEAPAAPRLIVYDAAVERERLEERLSELQRNVGCVWRAVRLMVFFTALALAGLGHSTILIPDWPQTISQYLMQWTIKAHCAFGLASSMCALVFAGVGLRYGRELSGIREECGRLAGEVIEGAAAGVVRLPVVTSVMPEFDEAA